MPRNATPGMSDGRLGGTTRSVHLAHDDADPAFARGGRLDRWDGKGKRREKDRNKRDLRNSRCHRTALLSADSYAAYSGGASPINEYAVVATF